MFKLCGQINEVKVITGLWMLVRVWVKGSQLPPKPTIIGWGLYPAATTHAHPHWPLKCPKGRPESCVTFPLTSVEGEAFLFFTALMGGCGEIRTLALQLNHTKGSSKRDVDESSPHAALVHQKQFTWNEPSPQQYQGCYTVKCSLKWITAGNEEAELKKREKKQQFPCRCELKQHQFAYKFSFSYFIT